MTYIQGFIQVSCIRFGPHLTSQEGSYHHSNIEEQHVPDQQRLVHCTTVELGIDKMKKQVKIMKHLKMIKLVMCKSVRVGKCE